MNWNLDKNRPICPQMCEQICRRIALGDIPPGERLLSVRDTAAEAGVNPNTVQHALETLEREGIIYSVRGSGWYVADDIAPAMRTLDAMREAKARDFFAAMETLGLDTKQTKQYIEEWKHE